MPLLSMLTIVVSAWLLILAVTGVIEHLRLRRDEHRSGVPLKS